MEGFQFFLVIAVFAGLHLLLYWMRKGGGGVVGRRVRQSDYWALQDAIEDKKRDIELQRERIHRFRSMGANKHQLWGEEYDLQLLQEDSCELEALVPKYKAIAEIE